jgi:hypothetical protein
LRRLGGFGRFGGCGHLLLFVGVGFAAASSGDSASTVGTSVVPLR